MTKQLNKNIIVLVALYIIPLTGLGMDIFVPSLPSVTTYFSTTHVLAQNTISLYILGLGISQLISGNIIDYYGRRMPLLVSLCGYFMMSILIIFSKSIMIVIFLRILQGICMGFSAVSARSIFLDLFTGKEYYKKASFTTIAYAMGPIVAPAIGGYLQHYFGWKSSFYFLSLYSFIGFVLAFLYIPETIKVRSEFSLKLVLIRYLEMLSEPNFVIGLICISMLITMSMLFSLIGPFLVQNELHFSSIVFGQMALLGGVAWFIGNVANRMLLNISRQRKINYALVFSILDVLVMFVLAQFWFNLYVMIIPICLLLVAASLMFSNYFVHLPTLFPNYSATAMAFMAGCFSLLSSGICATYSKIITTHNQVPLTLGYFGLVVTCVVLNLVILKVNKSKIAR